MIVIFEETGGRPEDIEIQTVNRNTICSIINDYHTPTVKSFERKNNQFRSIANPSKAAYLTCPENKVIQAVEYVAYGEEDGACGNFKPGKCSSPKGHKLVEQVRCMFH